MLPEFHKLEPTRALRLRLERAYVGFLATKKEPGFEIVRFSFDMESGLPSVLYAAVASNAKFHESIAGIPVLSPEEQIRRTLTASISSASSDASLQHSSEAIQKCAGSPLGNGLWTLEWKGRQDCRRPSYPNATLYVAEYDSHLALRMQCQDEKFPGLGCEVSFPFEGFAVDTNFHRDHLNDWRKVVDRVAEFLKSVQYH
jgi:hypothetical protein